MIVPQLFCSFAYSRQKFQFGENIHMGNKVYATLMVFSSFSLLLMLLHAWMENHSDSRSQGKGGGENRGSGRLQFSGDLGKESWEWAEIVMGANYWRAIEKYWL